MKKMIKWLFIVVLVLLLLTWVVDRQLAAHVIQPLAPSAQYRDGQFHNLKPREAPGLGTMMGVLKRYLTEQRIDTAPSQPLPMKQLTVAQLDALSHDELHLVKLGHSSMLLKVVGEYWLIDPVFSERASPFTFMGPERFQPTPIALEALPPIQRVLISHNHYDHLDQAAIEHLATITAQFFVPIGVEGDLQQWGVDPAKIKSFDWWQEDRHDEVLVAFTPAQHFSGRGLSDRNATLWGGWVIKTSNSSLFYSGDSGYFDGFKTIGQQYGPFDLTLIETGAYNTDWADIHLLPEESVQAHIDLGGVTLLPVHNGTFDLAFHPWYEPLVRISAAAAQQQVPVTTPLVGEIFTAKQSPINNLWWQQ